MTHYNLLRKQNDNFVYMTMNHKVLFSAVGTAHWWELAIFTPLYIEVFKLNCSKNSSFKIFKHLYTNNVIFLKEISSHHDEVEHTKDYRSTIKRDDSDWIPIGTLFGVCGLETH